MGYLAALVPVYVNGKGWRGLGFGFGGRKNVGMVLGMAIVRAQSAGSPARGKLAGAGVKLLAGLIHGMIRSRLLQTVGHPGRDQLQ